MGGLRGKSPGLRVPRLLTKTRTVDDRSLPVWACFQVTSWGRSLGKKNARIGIRYGHSRRPLRRDGCSIRARPTAGECSVRYAAFASLLRALAGASGAGVQASRTS